MCANMTWGWASSESSVMDIPGLTKSYFQFHMGIATPKSTCNRHAIADNQHQLVKEHRNRNDLLSARNENLVLRQLPKTIVGSCKSEISWHFPSASGHIVLSEVRCSFLVRADELVHKYLLGRLKNCTVAPMMIYKSILFEKLYSIVPGQ